MKKAKELANVKIRRVVHLEMKQAMIEIEKKTGVTLTIENFAEQAIREKIERSQILGEN